MLSSVQNQMKPARIPGRRDGRKGRSNVLEPNGRGMAQSLNAARVDTVVTVRRGELCTGIVTPEIQDVMGRNKQEKKIDACDVTVVLMLRGIGKYVQLRYAR